VLRSKDIGVMNRWVRWGIFVWCQTLGPPLWPLLNWASMSSFDYVVENVNGSGDGSYTNLH
jgi:hypothetical protein